MNTLWYEIYGKTMFRAGARGSGYPFSIFEPSGRGFKRERESRRMRDSLSLFVLPEPR